MYDSTDFTYLPITTGHRLSANTLASNVTQTVGQLLADSRPTVAQLSADCCPTVGRQLANSRPTVGQQWADCRPTVERQSADRFFGELFFTIYISQLLVLLLFFENGKSH